MLRPRLRAVLITACSLTAAALLAPAARAATYHGHSVDGPRYSARMVNDDLGAIDNVEIRFTGGNATVFLHGGYQIQLTLDDEDISDPRHIYTHDDRRGTSWELSVRNLR